MLARNVTRSAEQPGAEDRTEAGRAQRTCASWRTLAVAIVIAVGAMLPSCASSQAALVPWTDGPRDGMWDVPYDSVPYGESSRPFGCDQYTARVASAPDLLTDNGGETVQVISEFEIERLAENDCDEESLADSLAAIAYGHPFSFIPGPAAVVLEDTTRHTGMPTLIAMTMRFLWAHRLSARSLSRPMVPGSRTRRGGLMARPWERGRLSCSPAIPTSMSLTNALGPARPGARSCS